MSTRTSSGGALRVLARPATPADRTPLRLVAAALTGCGVFLLAAVAILDLPGEIVQHTDGLTTWTIDPANRDLAPFLAEPGLRSGTAFGTVLMILPFVLFGAQALRTGTA